MSCDCHNRSTDYTIFPISQETHQKAIANKTPEQPENTMSLALLSQSQLGLVTQTRRRSHVTARAAPAPALDKLMGATRLNVLEHADEELQNLCSSKATAEEQAQCWEVWKYYHDKRQQAQSGCTQELESEGAEGSNCHVLDNLERMVYEVAFSGDAEQLYHVLRTQSNMAKRSAQGSPEPSSKQEVLDKLKAKAMTMFEQIDLDGNGVLDREEFLSAMALLQHHLGEHEMEMIFSCMDSHGYITPDQFVNIVQAEQMCDTGSDADVLRHVPHARPNWWSDAPHYIMDV